MAIPFLSPIGNINISDGTPQLKLTDTSSSATTTLTLDGVNFTLQNNGTNGSIYLKRKVGSTMRNAFYAHDNGTVYLYHDGTQALATTSGGGINVTAGITTGGGSGGNSGPLTINGGITQTFQGTGGTTFNSHTNSTTASASTDASSFLISQKNTSGTAIEYRQGVIADGNAYFGTWQSGSITGMGLNIATGNVTFSGSITIPEYINHTDDGNTNFGFGGADDFRVTVGGTKRLNVITTGIEIAGNLTGGTDATFTGDIIATDGSDTSTLSETGLTLSRSNSYIQSNADNSDTLNIGQSSTRWGHVKVDSATFKVLNGGNERLGIDSSGNATFKEDLETQGVLSIRDASSNHQIKIQPTISGTSRIMAHNTNIGTNHDLDIVSTQIDFLTGSISGSDNSRALFLDSSRNATFTGTVTAAGFTGAVTGTATGLSGTPAISVGNITTSGYLRGPSSFTIDPATHADNTGTVVIAGNLQVDGTTTTINSTTVAIDDLNFSIATDAADSAAANGAGITIGGASATLLYTHATASWDVNKHFNVLGGKISIVPGSGAYDQLKLVQLDDNSSDKMAGIYTLNKAGNNTSIMQYSGNSGNNTVYYGSADGNYRGLTQHIFYVNSAVDTASSGHTETLRLKSDLTATFAGKIKSTETPADLSAAPTIAFGDGNTGFYERSDNDLRVSVAGSSLYEFSANCMGNVNEGKAHFNSETATATNPSVIPWRNDPDTGIGRASADNLSLIAGGTEGLRVGATTATFAGNISNASGHFTISSADDFVVDAVGQINLDADGGNIRFKDGGTHYGTHKQDSSHYIIEAEVADKDIILRGTDGSTEIDALRLDISEGGNAAFRGTITLGVADSSSGHINAYENMTFNIDTDNDDTNRYFAWYTNGADGSGTELLKILETGAAHFAGNVGIGDAPDEAGHGLEIHKDGSSDSIGILIHNKGTNAADDAKISFETQASMDYTIGIDRSDSNKFKISRAGDFGTNDTLTLATDNSATFAGAINLDQSHINIDGNGAVIFDNTNNNNAYYIRNGGTNAATMQWGTGTPGSNIKMVLNGSGKLGVGNENPDFHANASNLVVGSGSGNQGMTIFSGSSVGEYGSIYFADGRADGQEEYRGMITYEQNNEIMRFHTNTVEALKLDLNQNATFAGTITSTGLATFNDGITLGGSNKTLKLLYNNTANYIGNLGWAYLQLGNNGSNDLVAGNTATGGQFRFFTNNTNDIGGDAAPNGTLALTLASTGAATFTNPVTTDKIFVAKGQNVAHVASSIIVSQESTIKSQIRCYGADASTAGTFELLLSASDGAPSHTALAFDNSANATFAGTITATTNGSTFGNISVDRINLADNEKIIWGGGSDLQIYHQSSDNTSYIFANNTNALKIATETSGTPITIGHTTSETTIGDNLTVTGNVTLPGAILGSSNGGIRIHSSGSKFFSVNSSNTATNNVMDIGASDAKFKDLYLGGRINSVTALFTDNVYMTAGQLYIGASGANATTNDSHRLLSGSGEFKIQSRESGTWTDHFVINTSGVISGNGSGLTGVTSEWDGTHTGTAVITGDLKVTGSSEDLLAIASQSAGSGTIIMSMNAAENAYEPLRFDVETFKVTASGGTSPCIISTSGLNTTFGGDVIIEGDDKDFYVKSADHTISRIINRGSGADLDKGLFSLMDTGTEDIRIDTGGNTWINTGYNVGIGTVTPSVPLQVHGGFKIHEPAGNELRAYFNPGASATADPEFTIYRHDGASASVRFRPGTDNYFENNIGIGVTPIEKLHSAGAVISTGSNATGWTAGAQRAIMDLTSNGARIGHFRGTESAGSGSVKIYSDSTLGITLDASQNTTFAGDIIASTAGTSSGRLIVGGTSIPTSTKAYIKQNTHSGSTSNSIFIVECGDSSTYNGSNAIMHIKNAGNRGAKGHNDGSDLLKLSFSDGDALVVDKDGDATFAGDVGIKKAGANTLLYLQNTASVTSGNRGDLAFYNSDTSTVGLIRAGAVTDNVGTKLQFFTRPAGGSLAETFTLNADASATFAGDISIPTDKKLFFDGVSDTWIEEISADRLAIHVGGVMLLDLSEGGGGANDYVAIPAATKLYLDGGGTTYIQESSDGVIDFYGDGVQLFTTKQNGTQSEVVVNEGSGDVDFRVESNNSTHAFFVEAEAKGKVGIGDDNPDRKLSIIGDDDSEGQYPLSLDATNTDYTLEFRRNGTSEWWIKQSSGSFNIHENGVGDHLTVAAGGNSKFSANVDSQGYTINESTLQTWHDFQSRPIDTDSGMFTVGGHGMNIGYSRAISIWSTTNGVWRSWVGTNLRWDGTNYLRASNEQNQNWGNIAGLMFHGNSASTGKAIEFIIDPPENASGSVAETTIGTSLPSGYTALTINNDLSTTFAGNVGIGAAPTADVKLNVVSSDANWAAIIKNYTTSGYGLSVDCSGAASTNYVLAAYSPSGTGLFLNGAGDLGLGVTAPSSYYADKFVVYDGDEGGMTIANSSTSGKSYLCFADGTSGDAAYTGYVAYDHNDNSLSFATNGGNNRLTIASGGDATFAGNVTLAATKRLYLDGGTHTYIHEASDNMMKFIVGGTEHLAVGGGDVWIQQPMQITQYIYHQGDTSTQINMESSQITIATSGGSHVQINNDEKIYFRTNGTDRFTMSTNGDFTATGDVVAYSDERLKTDITTLDGSKVYDMRGVSFKKEGRDGSGVIAQELEKIAPELVSNELEYKSVAYGNITGYLIEAIKDLKAEIEELKTEVKECKSNKCNCKNE